jgi:proteasome lid subunit RPN8/RPN11
MSKQGTKCQRIANQYEDEIRELVRIQTYERREGIFFIYDDSTTTKVYKGGNSSISLTVDEEISILQSGNLVGSVHSHPSGIDPSTIDIMTGLSTKQESMCVVTPILATPDDGDFILTCVNLENMNITQRYRLLRAMRRSSVGISELGRQIRKQLNIERFDVQGCRTHSVENTEDVLDARLPRDIEFVVSSHDDFVQIDEYEY